MYACAWIAALLPAVTSAAQLWEEPRLGSAIGALDRSRYVCATVEIQARCRQASSGELFEVPTREQTLIYLDGRLDQVHTAFDEDRFEQMLQALEARLGRGELSTELLRAGMGGVFPSRLAIWRLDDEIVLLEQYSDRITRSAIWIMGPGSFAEMMSARDRQRVRGVRDL